MEYHDISRTELDENSGLPRFNMPLELGIFLGAKRFGAEEHGRKKCLVMDREQYRYQKFISDIAGQDVPSHNNSPEEVVKVVRDWLLTASERRTIPSGSTIWSHYQDFLMDSPQIAQRFQLEVEDLIFNDYTFIVAEWLTAQTSHTSRHVQGGN